LDLDKAVVSTYTGVPSDVTTKAGVPASSQTSHVADPNDTRNLGVTVGLLAIGLPILVLAIASGLLIFFFRRRRAARRPRKLASLELEVEQTTGGHVISHGYDHSGFTAVTNVDPTFG
jgi:hypothetical protein